MSDFISNNFVHFPTPIADSCLGYLSASNLNEKRDKIVEIFRVSLRYLGIISLADILSRVPAVPINTNLKNYIIKLHSSNITDGEWIGMIKEIVRPFAHNQEELTCPPIRDIFFKPNTDATNKKSIFLDRLNYMRRKETVAHGISGNKEFCENIISQRIPDLELLLQHLFSFKDYLLIKPFEVTIQKGEKSYLNNYYVLKGITSHRNKFPTNNLILSEPLETNKCYLFNPLIKSNFCPYIH